MGDHDYYGLGDTSTGSKATQLMHGFYIGIVKDNYDPAKMGSLKVLIPSLHGSDEASSDALIQVGYLSPYYGLKSANAVRDKSNILDFDASQHSYGMWMVPPDIDTRVMVIFVEGKPSQGYWIGCVQEPYMNHMVPGIAASRQTDQYQREDESASKTDIYGTDFVPAGEVNRAGIEFTKITGTVVDAFKKPIHPFAETLRKQGLIQDSVRGTTSSSARRESPSAVFGISTPGRPDTGKDKAKYPYRDANLGPTDASRDFVTTRTPGHTFVMDDGDAQGDNTLIRLRTGSGHQLLMHDTAGVMYLANAAGTVWMEFHNQGTVDIYAKQGINIRSGGDMNFHSEGDINMYANRNIRIKANEHLGEDPQDRTPKGIISIDGSIINQLAGRAMNVTVDKGYYSLRTGMSIYTQAAGGNQIHQASGQVHLVGSQVHFNSMPVDPNLLQPLQRTSFFSASGTGTLEVLQPDVTPVLRGSVGVLSVDRAIPGMTGMVMPTHEPYLSHKDNIRAFTAEGKVEDSNRPGTLGYAEYRNSISTIPEIVMGQYEARLEKYLNSLGLGVTDIDGRRRAADEFTRNYTSIFPGARDPFSIRLPGNIGISDVANQVIKRITGTQGLNLFKDQVFVNQAGVLYALGDLGKVITSLEANVKNIPGQLLNTAKNTISTTVGDIANNELKNLSRDVGSRVFSTAQDFFRGDGINTAALYDDLGQSVTGATSLVAGQGGLSSVFNTNVFGGRDTVGRVLPAVQNFFGRDGISTIADIDDLGQVGINQYANSLVAGPGSLGNVFGVSEIFKGNLENLFGKGVFGNQFISNIDLGNLSAKGLINSVGQTALNTGINIVTNQIRNVIAGEITSMTNVVGVFAKDAFGEIAQNVGDFFSGTDYYGLGTGGVSDLISGIDVGGFGASVASFFGF